MKISANDYDYESRTDRFFRSKIKRFITISFIDAFDLSETRYILHEINEPLALFIDTLGNELFS